LHGGVRELADGKWHGLKQADEVTQQLRGGASIQRRGVDGLRSGQFTRNFRFIRGIALPAVVREQRYFVIAGKVPENVIGADPSPSIDRKQLARFNPENSQMLTSKSVAGFGTEVVNHGPKDRDIILS